MIEEIKIEVYGRVQGVNFRNDIKSYCDDAELRGYVRNREDGSVIVIVQGEKKKLNEFLDWVQNSPGFSKIDGLSYRWQKLSVEYNEFTIVREGSFIGDEAKAIVNLGKHMLMGSSVIDSEKVPVHISIIPDGNRRWAKEKGMIGSMGHYKSGSKENILSLFEEAKKQGVKYMSVWGFSTENWSRDEKEIKSIFELVLDIVKKLRGDAEKNKIRFRHMGRKDRLPKNLREALEELEEETKNYDDFNVQLFLDYGGRDEIIRAVNKIIARKKGKIDEKDIIENLDTMGIPDPDLIIRTSGEKRVSGLMPWQSVYAEYYFSDVHFPDFDARELRKAIEDFGKRDRRFGGNTKK